MSALVQEFLQNWEAELLQLRSNDPLIDLSSVPWTSSLSALFQEAKKGGQLYKEFKKIERDRGVIALVQFEGILTWTRNQKVIQTPVFLKECQQINWSTQELILSEDLLINPFLALYFKKHYQEELTSKNLESLIAYLSKSEVFLKYEPIVGFSNLHPQRYELRKEWEAYKTASHFSNAVHQIIGDIDYVVDTAATNLETLQLSALDPDQRVAVKNACQNSVVIYGPPGTGKSVVLSNVIGQALAQGENVLVVAEKPIALEVIENKLRQFKFDRFCIRLDNQHTTPGFYKKLKQQFSYLLQASSNAVSTFDTTMEASNFWQQKRQLEQQTKLSFSELLQQFQLDKIENVAPSKRWQAWLHQKKAIEKLAPEFQHLLPLLQKYWQDAPIQNAFENWTNWQNLRRQIENQFRCTSLHELNVLVEKSLRCLQYQAKVYQNHVQILDQKPALQLKMLLQFQQLITQKEQLDAELKVWKQIPTLIEWESLKKQYHSTHWLAKLRWRQTAKAWLRTKGIKLPELEKNLKKYWRHLAQRAELTKHFDSIGIIDLERNIGSLILLLRQHQEHEWQWYRSLTDEQRQEYCAIHHAAHQLQQLHQQLFTSKAEDFSALEASFKLHIAALLAAQKDLQQISFDLWEHSANLIDLELQMKQEFWADLRYHYPELYRSKEREIERLFDKDLLQEEKVWRQNATLLTQQQIQQFKNLQLLLESPINKLTAQQKEQRQILRKGKAILVKEMAKSRQHMRIQTLFESPAANWLRVIFPVWLSSPTALAKNLPMQPNLFDIGLFDEASQLPLSHAIGSLQRISRAVIAGDPQQMRPQSYFSESSEGVVDLLHQAAFYLPSVRLTHHYRSEHPDLIAFSNAHFYENELKVWPSPSNPDHGLFDHYISDGTYQHQQNITEAKALAKHIQRYLDQDIKIGIVAFSETQLNCIYQQLNARDQIRLDQRLLDKSAFFLPLEQVQGEECEILFISFGYAKNEEGQFNLKLGPMTQAQSGRRLNVLLTRAQKAMHFFSSVRATDFPAKRSEATNKLWEWFLFLEKIEKAQHHFDAKKLLESAEDYATFLNYYRVLKQRHLL